MVTQPSSQHSELLTSWKEIASYLGKGVRTVQRWERQFGLPVRRPNQRAKGIVHATRPDLDRWLEMQWSQRGSGALPSLEPISADHGFEDEQPKPHNQIHSAIRQSLELRDANRRLLMDFQRSLQSIFEECRSLTRQMGGSTKPQ